MQNYNKELRNASEAEFAYFSINCDSQSESYAHELQRIKTQSVCRKSFTFGVL